MPRVKVVEDLAVEVDVAYLIKLPEVVRINEAYTINLYNLDGLSIMLAILEYIFVFRLETIIREKSLRGLN